MNGFFMCPRCEKRAAVWQSDFDAQDVGYEKFGIVTFYTCGNCDSEIEIFTPLEEVADDLVE